VERATPLSISSTRVWNESKVMDAILKTLQGMYGLGPLAGSQNATVITDIWK
jgi:hypothetical protein